MSAVSALQCVRLGGAAGCGSPGEVVSRRHVVGRRSPTRRRSAGVSHPRHNARRQGRCCPPFLAESRLKEKAACVSGGSAERPQFSRTGRAWQRGRRSRRRKPDPAGVFSMVMHLMIRREAFGCNRSVQEFSEKAAEQPRAGTTSAHGGGKGVGTGHSGG